MIALLPLAFCGFYINGAGGEMFNNATEVVMMRSGTRTVLSMQNNYQGPPTDFAMVVPVPVVLHDGDVKTLPKGVFAKIDTMSSPRLVEYWEQDPCDEDGDDEGDARPMKKAKRSAKFDADADDDADHGVTVEAKFDVAEYNVSILSAKDSTGLYRYLLDNHYKVPRGADALLRPYVENGSKFFVAKVDPSKVRFEAGQAMLSPLRFHYDSDDFSLPIRLGLANSGGTQDLIVNILAPGQRYELANYKNVTIPTNLDVKDDVRTHFGEFYAALFDRTLQENPGAIVTEYSWDAGSCDPCPGPVIDYEDIQTLGGDVIGDQADAPRPRKSRRGRGYGGGFVLTRVHARYGKDGVPNDLVFKAAPPIIGGREVRDDHFRLEHGAEASDYNNFQARYIIRHPWTGPIACTNPVRNRWGGPPNAHNHIAAPAAARNLAFVPRGQIELQNLVAQDVPEIAVEQGKPLVPPPPPPPVQSVPLAASERPQGCGCHGVDGGGAGAVALAFAFVGRRRRRA